MEEHAGKKTFDFGTYPFNLAKKTPNFILILNLAELCVTSLVAGFHECRMVRALYVNITFERMFNCDY